MNKEEVFNIIKEAIGYVIPEIDVNKVTLDDSLKAIGANSIDRAEILSIILEDSNVHIPMISFNEAKNINDIAEIIINAK